MGNSFVLFDVSMEISRGNRSHRNSCFPMGNSYLVMGKMAIVSAHICLANGSQRVQLLTETGLDT